MSNSKRNSTISTKPAIDPALQWIGGAAAEVAKVQEPADKQTSQQANMSASKHVNTAEVEHTAMFSARIPVSLIKKLRIRAATEGRPIQEIVAELFRNYVEND